MKVINNEEKYLYNAKKLLIVIDMLNGFLKEGALADKHIMRIVPRHKELIDNAIKSDDTAVIFVCDRHTTDSIEFLRYPPHALKGSIESELIDELKPFQKDAYTCYKNSTSIIFPMEKLLFKLPSLEEVYLIGCLSEICVFESVCAIRSFFDEYDKKVVVGIYKSGIDTYESEGHNADKINEEIINEMKNKGIEIYE